MEIQTSVFQMSTLFSILFSGFDVSESTFVRAILSYLTMCSMVNFHGNMRATNGGWKTSVINNNLSTSIIIKNDPSIINTSNHIM